MIKSSMISCNKIGNTILKKLIKFEIKQSGGLLENYFWTFCWEEPVCLFQSTKPTTEVWQPILEKPCICMGCSERIRAANFKLQNLQHIE